MTPNKAEGTFALIAAFLVAFASAHSLLFAVIAAVLLFVILAAWQFSRK